MRIHSVDTRVRCWIRVSTISLSLSLEIISLSLDRSEQSLFTARSIATKNRRFFSERTRTNRRYVAWQAPASSPRDPTPSSQEQNCVSRLFLERLYSGGTRRCVALSLSLSLSGERSPSRSPRPTALDASSGLFLSLKIPKTRVRWAPRFRAANFTPSLEFERKVAVLRDPVSRFVSRLYYEIGASSPSPPGGGPRGQKSSVKRDARVASRVSLSLSLSLEERAPACL